MLKQRVLTALVLVPLVIWVTLALPAPWFGLLLAVLVAFGAWEWAGFANLERQAPRLAYAAVVLVGIGLVALGMSAAPPLRELVLVLGLAWWLLSLHWIARFPAVNRLLEGRTGRLISGVIILVVAWAAVASLHASPLHGPRFVIFLLALVWVADTAAYFAGRRWGSRRLAPAVSPGKTWEGVWGALFATALVAGAAGHWYGLAPAGVIGFILLCEVTVAFSIVGDLVESLFKRMAGLKDSGGLLPGHGGVLDRVDSLTAAAPVFLLGLWLLRIPA